MCNVASVPSQVHNNRTVPIIYNKGYIAFFTTYAPKWLHFHLCVPRPWFPVGRRNFGDLCTFNAVIGLLLIFACILRTSSPKIGVLGAKWEKGWCNVYPQQTRFYFWVILRLCQFWWKCIKTCECESARRHTDRGKLV